MLHISMSLETGPNRTQGPNQIARFPENIANFYFHVMYWRMSFLQTATLGENQTLYSNFYPESIANRTM